MRDVVQMVVIGVVTAMLVLFVIGPYRVSGDSMYPTYTSGQLLIIEKISHKLNRLQVGDVIVFKLTANQELVKRITKIGSDGQYWVEGDNKDHSSDSRQFGYIPKDSVQGRVIN